jgi:NADH-quinone oxidoreductase subunit G
LVPELAERLRRAGRLGAVLSPFLTVEEAYMLAKYVRQLDPEAAIVLGHVPMVGQDERFPGSFTIAAEKCPNRRGVEAIVQHFMGRVVAWDEFLKELPTSGIRGLWVSGGYKRLWIDESTAAQPTGLDLLIVQDLFPSPLSDRADYVLPAAAFPERDGTYVNRHDHLQSVRWAIRPPRGVRTEGSVLWELLGRPGLYNAREVLSEVAAEIGYFHVAGRPIPDVGVNLKVNLLAS